MLFPVPPAAEQSLAIQTVTMTLTERAARMISIISVLVGLATIAVVLRIYARLKLRLMVKIDDYLCIGAMLCLLGMLTELILCKCNTML